MGKSLNRFSVYGINDPVRVAWYVIVLLTWHKAGDWLALRQQPLDKRFEYLAGTVYPTIRKITGVEWLVPDSAVPATDMLLDEIEELSSNFAFDTFGSLYEDALAELGGNQKGGLYHTPSHIVNLMVSLADPRENEVICDPALGSGSLILSAVRSGCRLVGNDVSSELVALARLNGYLFDFRYDFFDVDYLSSSLCQDPAPTLYLMNPPFNVVNSDVPAEVLAYGKQSETQFLGKVLDEMQPQSRLIVLLPNGVLFKSDKSIRRLRFRLLTEFDLQAVVSLPAGIFQPHTGVTTCLLVIQNRLPQSDTPIWFSEIRADGLSLDTKRRSITANDIPDLVARFTRRVNGPCPSFIDLDDWQRMKVDTWWYIDSDGVGRQCCDGPREWTASRSEIAREDYCLVGARYKPFSLTVSDTPPLKELIQSAMDSSRNILAGLDELERML